MEAINRRTFLGLAAGALTVASPAATLPIPIIDTHIHLFDPDRPQGVPWPSRDEKVLYKPALPARYEQLVTPFHVIGAIEIEASPWLEDNQWVLDIAAQSPIIVGTVGNLDLGTPAFRKNFERFRKNDLFRGIRYGNLWGRDLGKHLDEPAFLQDLQLLAESNLALDTANPDPELIHSIVRLSDKLPNLRIVLDHLPHLKPPEEPSRRRAYESDLRDLGSRPKIFVKLSEIVAAQEPGAQLQASTYRATLDHLFDIFGEDRVLYGSDWPNSDLWSTYEETVHAAQHYFATKSRAVREKFFWKNSIAAYHWRSRTDEQRGLRIVGDDVRGRGLH